MKVMNWDINAGLKWCQIKRGPKKHCEKGRTLQLLHPSFQTIQLSTVTRTRSKHSKGVTHSLLSEKKKDRNTLSCVSRLLQLTLLGKQDFNHTHKKNVRSVSVFVPLIPAFPAPSLLVPPSSVGGGNWQGCLSLQCRAGSGCVWDAVIVGADWAGADTDKSGRLEGEETLEVIKCLTDIWVKYLNY